LETPDSKEREDQRVIEEILANHTKGLLDLQEYQVLLVSMAWLGTADPAIEDPRARPERPVSRVRRVPQVSQGSARRRCVWPRRPTPPRDYRRPGGSKDKGEDRPFIPPTPEDKRERERNGEIKGVMERERQRHHSFWLDNIESEGWGSY